jgi:hypothetical protein
MRAGAVVLGVGGGISNPPSAGRLAILMPSQRGVRSAVTERQVESAGIPSFE